MVPVLSGFSSLEKDNGGSITALPPTERHGDDGKSSPPRDTGDGGFEGCSWKPVVPLNRITAVRYDEASYWDDFAYLAAVPSSVFYSEGAQKLYSNPLLFYEPASANRVENANKGMSYFLDDWTEYLDGEIDEAVLIGLSPLEESEFLSSWPVDTDLGGTEVYRGETPFELARKIAVADWDVADSAVVAVINESYAPVDSPFAGSVNGTMPGAYSRDTFRISDTIDVSPAEPLYHNFTVAEPTRFVSAYMSWSGAGKDPDLQLYDWNMGQVAASERWNPIHGASESASSYAYNRGPWAAAVTYMPTESLPLATTDVNPADYNIDVSEYPGVEVELPACPYYCRDITITLSWPDAGQGLGLAITGPGGENVATSLSGNNPTVLRPLELGTGNYTATVLKLDGHAQETEFTIDFQWSEKGSSEMRDALMGASGGAVLASLSNSPLLYVTNDSVPGETVFALGELNVSDVILLDIGNHAADAVVEELLNATGGTELTRFVDYGDVARTIAGMTGSGDVVISTLDPWTKWSLDKTPGQETAAGLYVGPSAFAAAHHGAPLLLCEGFDALSRAKAWHNTYWRSQWNSRDPPSVGDMFLTASQIYDVLDELGLDGDGMESVLSVAGQYDLGVAWDRTLVGAAVPGRIIGSPTDSAYSISRNIFYPAVIYSSPAMDPEGRALINGSQSRREVGDVLNVYRDEAEENYTYPILQTWVSYEHRFNERASRYWGTNYTCANGIVPFWDETNNPIDQDVNARYGRPGMYWPDLTNSESLTFYGDKCGYESAFSTYYPKCAENLNRGVIMWLETMHGGQSGSGILGFWKGGSEPEENPWRAYETYGSTEDPDTIAMRKDNGQDTQRSLGEDDRDGVIIAINEQSHTTHISGLHMDDTLDNIHSTGFLAGSCLVANTFLHLSLIRHGSVFQVIDPWVTSWYASYGYEIFMRYLALNMSVGQAYQKCMEFVGIQYLTEQWWWDILENVVYFGDPDLRVFVPEHGWDEPVPLNYSKKVWIEGHTPFGKFCNVGLAQMEVSDALPDQFENFTVNVTLFNDGSRSVRNLPLTLFAGGKKTGEQMLARLDPDTTESISWILNLSDWGTHVLRIRADPADLLDEANESDNSLTVNITVNALPIPAVSLSSTAVRTGENITFNATGSGDPDGDIAGYLFDFGDGGSTGWVDVPVVEHGYADNGTYDGSLAVRDGHGAVSPVKSDFRIAVSNRVPMATFSVEPGDDVLTFEEIVLNASASTDLDGTIVNWTWESGDNRTFYGPTVRLSYNDDGSYAVCLNVTDDDGDRTGSARTVTVLNRAPTASFSVEPRINRGNRSTFFTFTTTSGDPDGSIAGIQWDMGDGTVIKGENSFVHRYRELGSYNVSLAVEDDDGAYGESSIFPIVIENVLPSVEIETNTTVLRTLETFRFRARGADSDGVELHYHWDFGDGGNYTGEGATHVYGDDGRYTVNCTVRDADGSTNWATTEVRVLNRAPVAHISASNSKIATGSGLTLDSGNSDDLDGSIIRYGWDFGDGTHGEGVEVVHSFGRPGVYVVNLTVTDDDNATGFSVLEITVLEPDDPFREWLGSGGVVLYWGIPLLILFILLVLLIFVMKKRRDPVRNGDMLPGLPDDPEGAGEEIEEKDAAVGEGDRTGKVGKADPGVKGAVASKSGGRSVEKVEDGPEKTVVGSKKKRKKKKRRRRKLGKTSSTGSEAAVADIGGPANVDMKKEADADVKEGEEGEEGVGVEHGPRERVDFTLEIVDFSNTASDADISWSEGNEVNEEVEADEGDEGNEDDAEEWSGEELELLSDDDADDTGEETEEWGWLND